MTLPAFDSKYIIIIVCNVLAFIPAIVLHEVAHGFAAYKLGDPTAKAAGRLSLNPLKHIDLFGTVIMPAFLMLFQMPVFGYAKPVPYNPMYFEDRRKGDLIVGLAGPCANLAMALVGAGCAWLIYFLSASASTQIIAYVYLFFTIFVQVNLCLMVFNLLPIPPLDGSSIFAVIIPPKYMPQYYKIQQYALPIFMILVIIVPYVFKVNPIGSLLNATAGNLTNILLPV